MKTFQFCVLIFITFLFYFANCEEECPTYDKQIIGTFIGIDYFTSWKECGHFCETSPECEFWTIGGIDSYPDGCTIYSASYELRQHAGAISGSKSCH